VSVRATVQGGAYTNHARVSTGQKAGLNPLIKKWKVDYRCDDVHVPRWYLVAA
jgi:hypothetical protein